MGIRIQPKDIEVPLKNPFIHDRLDRKSSVEALTHLLSNFESPCVIAVDAPWGDGKSTFLKMWSRHLQTKKFHIIQFNAWETDYSDDPYIVVVEELLDSITKFINLISEDQETLKSKLNNAINRLGILAKDTLIWLVPGIVRNATAGIVDLDKVLEKKETKSSVEKRKSVYQEAKISFQHFKDTLAETATLLSESNDGKPLIIMIDELDRCRPTYAVELLEITKHLFAVDRLIFVMAVNCSQLEHSVNSLYGTNFDAEGYLKRFFDLKFQLPIPSRKDFIEQLLTDSGIFHYSERTSDQSFNSDLPVCREFLESFSENSNVSLRTLAQAIHHIGLVFASLPNNHLSFALPTVVLLIIRTIHTHAYREFIEGQIDDLELIEELSNASSIRNWKKIKHIDYVEAIAVLSFIERSKMQSFEFDKFETPLLSKYQKITTPGILNEEANKIDIEHAKEVINSVDYLKKYFSQNYHSFGYKFSVERIELFSEEISAFYSSNNEVNG